VSRPIDAVVSALASGGYDPTPSGDAYESRCPVHNGSRHNLSVAEGADGRALLYCHHSDGCSTEAIAGAIGLRMGDLFPAGSERSRQGKGPASHRPAPRNPMKAAKRKPADRPDKGKGWSTARGAIEWLADKDGATKTGGYPYVDADGVPVANVYRLRLPDGGKSYRPIYRSRADGRWRIGDPREAWPLYRLPEIMNSECVYVLEGEKCAEIARLIGLPATTTSHGAESAEKTDFVPLAGKDVMIVPDHDDAGEKYAAGVVAILGELDPRPRVKVLRLPGLENEGDDVEQFVDARGGFPEGWGDRPLRPGDLAEDEASRMARIRAEIEAAADEVLWGDPAEMADTGEAGDRDAEYQAEADAYYLARGQAEADTAKRPADGVAPARPGSQYGDLEPLPTTDLGNGERLVKFFGDKIRFCHPWGKWLIWDRRRWKLDDTAGIYSFAKVTARHIFGETKLPGVDHEDKMRIAKWAVMSEMQGRVESMAKCASREEGIPVLPDALDRDPWLLNCRNGTIDLRTGQLRPHDRNDMLTKMAPVDFDPDAECPMFMQTLRTFLVTDELIGYWQRLCGMAITGQVEDHILPICYGTGSNGKSTLLNTLIDILGPDYAMKAAPDLLVARKQDGHPTDKADLFGKRVVVAIETDEGARLNESLIKELTGGDKIRARRMREDFWEFDPTHTVFLATNHKPQVRGTDHGIWRRLKLVPFTVKMADDKAKKDMPTQLKKEAAGILAWMVRGCLAWQKDGLNPPKSMLDATQEYRAEEDVLATFLAEHCIVETGQSVFARDLYARYRTWAAESGLHQLSQTRFGKAIAERGFEKEKSSIIKYLGIGLMHQQGQSGRFSPNSGMNELSPSREEINGEIAPNPPNCPNGTETEPGAWADAWAAHDELVAREEAAATPPRQR
jgi:putative DNA primase/helicase